MVVDFGKQKMSSLPPVCIHGQEIEGVEKYKYLGTILN